VIGWGPIVVVVLSALAGYALVLAAREFMNGAADAIRQHAQSFSPKDRPEGYGRRGGRERGDKRTENEESVLRPSRLGWYDVLGVSQTASLEEIRSAYLRMITLYHPDRVTGLGEEFRLLAEHRAKEINAAYGTARRRHPTWHEGA
jgi:DnaJ-domain-containing protein 1